ncbi:hypothetical protein BH09BAC5_BH09BAC5_01600 [soil metagenome]
MKDHYQTLGVSEKATAQEIKLAYRKLAKRYHPDVNAGAIGAEEKFKEVSEAYDVLSDFHLRQAYDAKRYRPLYNWADFTEEKKDPRKREYSEEDLERVRTRHKKKILANMVRRKKMLVGMVITFIIFMFASAYFENWIENKREADSKELAAKLKAISILNDQVAKSEIESMDSPYDSLFGSAVYQNNSTNKLVIYMPFSDAVVCAVQHDPPYKTIRNEFIHAKEGFAMPELPNGKYDIKFYVGKNWNMTKAIPDGRKMGGFTTDEQFLKVNDGPYVLPKKRKKGEDTLAVDTIRLSPGFIKLDTISRETFFFSGK